MDTITGQYLDEFPRIRLDRVPPPRKHLHRLDRPSRALPIWVGIAAAAWILALVRVW